MANNKDDNANLGHQTIEGTEPPIEFDAEIVMPDGTSEPIIVSPSEGVFDPEPIVTPASDSISADAADLDAQLDALLGDMAQESVPPAQDPADLDAQLDALLGDMAQESDPPAQDPADLDAQLDAMLGDMAQESVPPAQDPADLDAQLDALLGDMAQESVPPAQDPAEAIATPNDVPADTQQTAPQNTTVEPEPVFVPPMQSSFDTPAPPVREQSAEADAAMEMMRQAQLIMQQAQAAQLQAQQAQAAAQMSHTTSPGADAATQAAKEMMHQAQIMMQQAQAAQMQSQTVQAVRSAATANGDTYSVKEIDRLKNELDGMRDLVNKLTISLAQVQNTPHSGATAQPYFVEADPYRRLENEFERMRREIAEKDLRDKEKELERKQREAENSVKDIRPEMIQMSDSRDVALPNAAAAAAGLGGEYIPLANGVFYSTKDRQVYVMTPAANAASASPTLEPKKAQPQKRPAGRPKSAPAKRASAKRPAHRRPGSASAHRRPPSGRGGRPTPHR